MLQGQLGPVVPVRTTPLPARPHLVAPPHAPARAPAGPARMRRRHWGIVLSFLILVALPAAVCAWYLWTRAADQYASYVGFSVRREDSASALEMLGGLSALSGSSSADTDILYDYMFSPGLVAAIDDELDLRSIWSKAPDDPVFAYAPPGAIEDLVDHWKRKVRISYDSGTHLIEIRVLAFEPEDATRIAQAILDRSDRMINALSDIAREDILGAARADLAAAETRVATARATLTTFRDRNQIVDPGTDAEGQTGLLAKLQEQLAEALIDVDMMAPEMPASDHRLRQAQARVGVIEARIAAERKKLGPGASGDPGVSFASVVGEYERLTTDLEFAEESYHATRAALDAALADARRQGRYLAAHIAPTHAETARFPQRKTLFATTAAFLLLGWGTLVLVAYALRDRR